MTTILDITQSDIERLTDVELRELVTRLCSQELKRLGLPMKALTAGGGQNDTDGGIDVRVSLDPSTFVSGFIERSQTAFQVKAEDMPNQKIIEEMKPNGLIRDTIKELASAGGAYIIVSSKGSLSDKALKARKAAMRACLKGVRSGGKLFTDFYDRQRLVTCAQQHPSLVAWVRLKAGRPIAGWQPYGAWSYGDDVTSDYILDDRCKLLTPTNNTGLDANAGVAALRNVLSSNQKSVRLTGLSGVGKTRLVQALFDERIGGASQALNSNSVLYTDLSDQPNPPPVAIVDMLLDRGDEAIVVIDNCGADLHQRLTQKVITANSKLSLVTIEYDIRDDLPEATTTFRLEPSSDELIKSLLSRRFKKLSSSDKDKIADFSGGNSRVALALANTATHGGELSKLTDDELFRRLFEQRQGSNDELLAASEACAILYSFNGVVLKGANAELPVLAGLAETTGSKLYGQIEKLRSRGLIQSRGQWRAVLPHAVANRLAQQCIKRVPPSELQRVLVTEASDRVRLSYARRLGYLHEEPIAQQIVSGWLGSGGILGNIQELTWTETRMLANVAPANPQSALTAIDAAAMNFNFVSIKALHRNDFTRLVRQIAYDTDFFDQSLRVLLRFAEVEPVEYRNDPATKMIASLFQIHVSGTQAPPAKRAAALRQLCRSENEAHVRIAFNCLESSLEAEHFNNVYQIDFGSRKRTYGWSPNSAKEYASWYDVFSEIGLEYAKLSNEAADQTKALFAEKLGGLSQQKVLWPLVDRLVSHFARDGEWYAGWRAIKTVRRRCGPSISPDYRAKLAEWEVRLRPTNIIGEIRARVFAKGIWADEIDDEVSSDQTKTDFPKQLERHREAITELGRQAGRDESILLELAPELVRTDGANLCYFAEGVGQVRGWPAAVIQKFKEHFADAPSEDRHLQFLTCVMRTAAVHHGNEISNFLETCVSDHIFGPYFPILQYAVPLDSKAVVRLLLSLSLSNAPAWRYSGLAWGRTSDTLTASEVISLLENIAGLTDGPEVAFDIAHMVVHCADEKSEQYRALLRSGLRGFLLSRDWTAHKLSGSDLELVLDFCFADAPFDACGSAILTQVVARIRTNQGYMSGYERYLACLLKWYPDSVLDRLVGDESPAEYSDAIDLIRSEDEHRVPIIGVAPTSSLAAWAQKANSPQRYQFLAAACYPFSKNSNGEYAWSPLALQLLTSAPNTKEVVREFACRVAPMSWSGSRADIIRRRTALIERLPSDHGLSTREVSPFVADLRALEAREKSSEEEEERSRDERFE